MKGPFVYIMCRAYNCEKYIEKTIESVLAQTYENYKFLILENGSTDGTRNILRRYKDNPKIVLQEADYNDVIYPDKHVSKSWRDIVEIKESDYITTLDSDDYFEKDALENLVTAAVEHDADMVISGCNMFLDQTGEVVNVRKPGRSICYSSYQELAKDWTSLYGSIRTIWSKLYKSTIYFKANEKVRNFKLRNGGDTLTNIEALDVAEKIVAIDKVTVNYRLRGDSIYASRIVPDRYKAYDIILEETYRLFEKWGVKDIPRMYITEAIRQSAIVDLVINTARSKVDLNNNVELLNNIFKNNKYIAGIRTFSLEEGFVSEVVKAFSREAYLDEYSPQQFTECPALILTEAMAGEKINLGMYLAALYHINNPANLGITVAKEAFSQLPKEAQSCFGKCNIQRFFENKNKVFQLCIGRYFEASKDVEDVAYEGLEDYMLNREGEVEKEVTLLRENIERKLELGENATSEIWTLLNRYPLDRDGIKYLMVNGSTTGNPLALIEGALLTESFYGADIELLYLAAMSYGQMGMLGKGIGILRVALNIAQGEEQKEIFEKEIENFETILQGGNYEQ